MKEASVARPEGALVVDQLHLQDFIRPVYSLMAQQTPKCDYTLLRRTLSVSMGQTTIIASVIPAPKPHKRLRVLSSRPVASRIGLLSISNVPNL